VIFKVSYIPWDQYPPQKDTPLEYVEVEAGDPVEALRKVEKELDLGYSCVAEPK
jgi:hypothetical protein